MAPAVVKSIRCAWTLAVAVVACLVMSAPAAAW